MIELIQIWYLMAATLMLGGTAGVFIKMMNAEKNKQFYSLFLTTGVAFIAYLLMFFDISLINGDFGQVYLARYVDWLITTPLMLLFVGKLVGTDHSDLVRMIGLDIVMITLGFGAVITTGFLSYGLYLAAFLAMLGVFYYLHFPLRKLAMERTDEIEVLFTELKNIIIVIWLFYPATWIIGPFGARILELTTAALVFAYLDVISKVVFVLLAAYKSKSWLNT